MIFFMFLNYITMHTITLTRANITNAQNNIMSYSIPGGTNLEGSEIALSSLYMYYSWENINDAPLNNNTFTISWPPLTTDFTGAALATPQPATLLQITIPNGIYEVVDVNAYLQQFCIDNNLYLINSTTGEYVYFVQMQVNISRYALQFNSFSLPTSAQTTGYSQPPGGFCNTPLLPNAAAGGSGLPGVAGQAPGWCFPANFSKWAGFPTNYCNPPGAVVSPFVANNFTGLGNFPSGNTSFLSTITPQVNPDPVIFLNCNLISNKFATPSTFMFPIPGKSGIASLLSVEVSEFAWNKMVPGQFNELRLFFTGVDGQPVTILDPNIIVTLVIRTHEDKSLNIGASNVGGIPRSGNTLQELQKLQHNPRGAKSQHGAAANLLHGR